MKNPVTDKEDTPTPNNTHIDRGVIPPMSIRDMTVEMTDFEGKKVPFTLKTEIVEKVLNVARGGAYEGDEGSDSHGVSDRSGLPRKVRLHNLNNPLSQTVVIELPKHQYVEGIRWQNPPYFWPEETGFRIGRTKKK